MRKVVYGVLALGLLYGFHTMMKADAKKMCSDDNSAMTWQECQWVGNR